MDTKQESNLSFQNARYFWADFPASCILRSTESLGGNFGIQGSLKSAVYHAGQADGRFPNVIDLQLLERRGQG